jgi:proline dehydrogenase
VPVRSGSELRRLLEERLLGRALAGRLVAGPDPADAVRVAAALVQDGCRVGLEHLPGPGEDLEAALVDVVRQVRASGLAGECELTLPVDRLGVDGALRIGRSASDAGLAVVLAGPAEAVDAVDLPGTGAVVRAGDPGAEDRCRALAGGHVRLVPGPGRRGASDLAFVRCLNVLMAAEGRPGIAVPDPRLIAIAGERAAWNGRTPDSWELVMSFGVQILEQQRLVAAGCTVRVVAPSGAGAAVSVGASLLTRSLGGRS